MKHVSRFRISARCFSILIAIVLMIAPGCGASSQSFPVPVKGYNTKRVEYPKGPAFTMPSVPRSATAVIAEVPRTDFSKLPARTLTLPNVTQASPSQSVSYEGKLFNPPPVKAQTMIFIECFQLRTVKVVGDKGDLPENRISRVLAATGVGLSRHLDKGESDYRVEFSVPKVPGKYEVEVSALYVPDSSVKKVIATGTLEVR